MNSASELLVASIGGAACWALWFFFYKEYRIAAFREQIFAMRDELFTFAAEGNISFEHPAYIELRKRLNALCRFAHHVSLPTLVIATRCYRTMPLGEDSLHWQQSLTALPSEERRVLERLHAKMTVTFTKYLIEGSVLLLALVSLYAVSLNMLSLLKQFFKPRATQMDVRERILLSMADTLDVPALESRAYAVSLAEDSRDLQTA